MILDRPSRFGVGGFCILKISKNANNWKNVGISAQKSRWKIVI
jgi:hypothetical protein